MKFICPNCGIERGEINSFISRIVEGKIKYFEKNTNNPIKCLCCNSDCEIDNEKNTFDFNMGKFSSMTLQEKQNHLKQRSRRDGIKVVKDYNEMERYSK